jgi:hypothetical protein
MAAGTESQPSGPDFGVEGELTGCRGRGRRNLRRDGDLVVLERHLRIEVRLRYRNVFTRNHREPANHALHHV